MKLQMVVILGATLCSAATAAYGADNAFETLKDSKGGRAVLAESDLGQNPANAVQTDVSVPTTRVTVPVTESRHLRPGETKPTEQQIKDWNAPIKGFHPIKRMLRPLWKLRQEARSLEDDIVTLQKPMAGLQPAFASMESRMGGVQDELKSMGKELSGVNGNLHRLSGDLSQLKELAPTLTRVNHELKGLSTVGHDLQELKGVREDIRTAAGHMQKLQLPLSALKEPLMSVTKPLATVEGQLTTVNGKVVRVHTELVQMESQITELIKEMQGLRQPMHGVTSPLSDVRTQLDSLNKLLTIILYAVAAVAVGMFVFGLIFLALAFKLRNKISLLLADKK